jgi:hypothetical protein
MLRAQTPTKRTPRSDQAQQRRNATPPKEAPRRPIRFQDAGAIRFQDAGGRFCLANSPYGDRLRSTRAFRNSMQADGARSSSIGLRNGAAKSSTLGAPGVAAITPCACASSSASEAVSEGKPRSRRPSYEAAEQTQREMEQMVAREAAREAARHAAEQRKAEILADTDKVAADAAASHKGRRGSIAAAAARAAQLLKAQEEEVSVLEQHERLEATLNRGRRKSQVQRRGSTRLAPEGRRSTASR